MSDALRDWEAVLGVIDGGRQHLLETQLPEALERLLPTPGSARHCNRQDAVARHAGAGPEIRGVGAIAERVEMVERGGRSPPCRSRSRCRACSPWRRR